MKFYRAKLVAFSVHEYQLLRSVPWPTYSNCVESPSLYPHHWNFRIRIAIVQLMGKLVLAHDSDLSALSASASNMVNVTATTLKTEMPKAKTSQSPVKAEVSSTDFWALVLKKKLASFQLVIPRVTRGPRARELGSRIYSRACSPGKRSRDTEEEDMAA
eukprot:750093-Amphidinium_carterae.2